MNQQAFNPAQTFPVEAPHELLRMLLASAGFQA